MEVGSLYRFTETLSLVDSLGGSLSKFDRGDVVVLLCEPTEGVPGIVASIGDGAALFSMPLKMTQFLLPSRDGNDGGPFLVSRGDHVCVQSRKGGSSTLAIYLGSSDDYLITVNETTEGGEPVLSSAKVFPIRDVKIRIVE